MIVVISTVVQKISKISINKMPKPIVSFLKSVVSHILKRNPEIFSPHKAEEYSEKHSSR